MIFSCSISCAHKLSPPRRVLEAGRANFVNTTAAVYPEADKTRTIETKRRQLIERRDKVLQSIHDIEDRLGITERWVPSSDEWVVTAAMVQRRNYRRCLDTLEGLIVARIFELSKMNMPQTGALTAFGI